MVRSAFRDPDRTLKGTANRGVEKRPPVPRPSADDRFSSITVIGVVLTIVTALTDGAVAVQVYPVLCPFLLLLRLLSLLLALLLFLLFLLSLPFHFVDHAPLFPLPFFSIRRPAASLHSWSLVSAISSL